MGHLDPIIQILLTVVTSVLASSGLWAYVNNCGSRKNAEAQMLIGLGHDRIIHLGMTYIDRGYITKDEYENLYDYLYMPYAKLGGNGSAKRVMDEVSKLEIRNDHDLE